MNIYFYLFLSGLALGSFFNVIIYRWSKGLSIVFPPSHCPHCKKNLKWYHNIPLVSYIFLKGRCAYCKKKISLRYPFVELLTACFFVYAYYKTKNIAEFIFYSFFTLTLIPLSFIDIEIKEIPDTLSLSLIIAGWIFSLFRINPFIDFKDSILSSFCGAGLLFLINEFYYKFTGREGLGMGDYKLMAGIGAFLGYKSFYTTLFLGSVFGISAFLLRAILKKLKKEEVNLNLTSEFPFGPFLSLGSLCYLYNWVVIKIF